MAVKSIKLKFNKRRLAGFTGNQLKLIAFLLMLCDHIGFVLIENGVLYIEIKDKGVGIEDVEKAMEPLYTSKPELERSGMGFSFMEAFMDELEVESTPSKGTTVKMQKKLQCGDWIRTEE